MNIQTDASEITQEELDHIHRMMKIARIGRISAQARTAKRRNQVRILREVANQIVLEDEKHPGKIPADIVTGARNALEATKD